MIEEVTMLESQNRRVYKREQFTHITFNGKYYGPAFNVTRIRNGARVTIAKVEENTVTVDVGILTETWYEITGGLPRPNRKQVDGLKP